MSLLSRVGAFIRQDKGGVAVMFAIAAVPLILAAGAAIDYSRVVATKGKVEAAADAAVLAATNGQSASKSVDEARRMGLDVFTTLTQGIGGAQITGVSLDISEQGLTRSARISYSLQVPTTLTAVVGIQSMQAQGVAVASQTRAPYLDVYLVLDNSPSMGLGATTRDINLMTARLGCAFACHEGTRDDMYVQAKKIGALTRIESLRMATQQLIAVAGQTVAGPNQLRMAAYSFGLATNRPGLTQIFGLTSNLDLARARTNAFDLMLNVSPDLGSPIQKILRAANQVIPSAGDGFRPDAPQKVLFFVSDGVADERGAESCWQSLHDSGRCEQPVDPSICDAMKARGIKIAALYTTYLPLPGNEAYDTRIRPFQNLIGPRMQACASPGLYAEVNPSQSLTDTMVELFKQSVKTTRLTQ